MIDFKLQTKISVIASILSGIIAIIMALSGYGVWSLVAKTLTNQGFNALMLWYWNKWKPDFIFSNESFKELFSFGSKLLVSGLLVTLVQNINYIVIGKYFTPQDLGYFTRAEMFKNLPSENVSSVVTSVGYPVLATIQDDKPRMKEVFRKMFTTTFFIIAILTAGMAGTAKSLILTLVGEQWLPSVPLLQMLCFVGLMYPLNSMNINILNVVGRSDLYLRLQTIVQVLAIPNIFVGVFLGIKPLVVGMIVISLVGYLIFNFESNKILNYSIKEQLKDISVILLLAVGMGISVLLIGVFSNFKPGITLTLQVSLGVFIVIIAGELLKLQEYIFVKGVLIKTMGIRYLGV
jgi:O-antigen/teichoic acid export membrane protein